jgi:hypothetical protein
MISSLLNSSKIFLRVSGSSENINLKPVLMKKKNQITAKRDIKTNIILKKIIHKNASKSEVG